MTRGRDAPELPTASPTRVGEGRTATYLNIKMKSTKREKNTATLSIVRSITKSCRRKFGRNRTSFRILSKRKVRRTLRPELPPRSSTTAWHSSTTLETRSLGVIGYRLVVSIREKLYGKAIYNITIRRLWFSHKTCNTVMKHWTTALTIACQRYACVYVYISASIGRQTSQHTMLI